MNKFEIWDFENITIDYLCFLCFWCSFWVPVCFWLAKRFGHELGESRENSNCKLDQIPKVHEGEPEKQSQGSPKLGDQGLHGVDESLGLH